MTERLTLVHLSLYWFQSEDPRPAELTLVGPGRDQTVYMDNEDALRLIPYAGKEVLVQYSDDLKTATVTPLDANP